MSNSSLVNYTRLSPNRYDGRIHKIDTITIHCVVGQCSVETLGSIFANANKEASSNYGVGYDGRIGMYVEEKNASWCSSSYSNDNRAVTIEVASNTYDPYYVNDKAYNATINLVADICKRNGIKKLIWSTDKNTRVNHLNGCNMTVHRDYANKSCPGDYLYNRMGDIASKVNKKLNTTSESEENTMEAKLNDKNNFVWVIKKDLILLKKLGVITQGVDDNYMFGNGTLEAIKQVQKKAGIKVDGICGTETVKAIGKLLSNAVSQTNSAELNKYKTALSNANTKISNAKKALS